MKIPRLYLDTSVIGGYYDLEFLEPTRQLFARIGEGKLRAVISTVVEEELAGAPLPVQEFARRCRFEVLQETPESIELAQTYIREDAATENLLADCRHVAIAAVAHVDLMVSWNFKHIVQFDRIRAFNAVNLKRGYGLLDILSPLEVSNYGK